MNLIEYDHQAESFICLSPRKNSAKPLENGRNLKLRKKPFQNVQCSISPNLNSQNSIVQKTDPQKLTNNSKPKYQTPMISLHQPFQINCEPSSPSNSSQDIEKQHALPQSKLAYLNYTYTTTTSSSSGNSGREVISSKNHPESEYSELRNRNSLRDNSNDRLDQIPDVGMNITSYVIKNLKIIDVNCVYFVNNQ